MEYIFEVKLSAEERNELASKDFGLPKERKYPLNDENHVRSAITYFKYCKKDKCYELAKNINKKLKQFDMKVNVSKDNLFYRFIDRKYLLESDKALSESSYTYELASLPKEYEIKLSELLHYQFTEEKDLINMEMKYCKYFAEYKDNNLPNVYEFLTTINNIFSVIYKDFINYLNYTLETMDLEHDFWYALYIDIFNCIMMKLSMKDYNIKKELDMINTFRNSSVGNRFYLYRNLICIYKAIDAESTDQIELLKQIKLLINDIEPMINTPPVHDTQTMYLVVSGLDKCPRTTQLLTEYRIYIQEQIQKLTLEMNIGYEKPFTLPITQEINNSEPYQKYKLLESNNIASEVLHKIGNNLSPTLSEVDIMRITTIRKHVSTLLLGHYYSNKELRMYYAINDTNNILYCIMKDPSDSDHYGLIKISDEIIDYLRVGDDTIKRPPVTTVNIHFKRSSNLEFDILNIATEGFKINKDGDMTITINPNKSYMDQYAEAHRILKENEKNKNYDAMKTNLAYMFSLISIIERDKKYKDRDKDTVKARAFAINDFKSYLAKVQKADPKFNFIEFYKNNNYDRLVLTVPGETILGIKKLFQMIIA